MSVDVDENKRSKSVAFGFSVDVDENKQFPAKVFP